ncbi:hypothetical protein MXB_1776 [Myxobolus squamalis]|nr:hypothetical protein MXB_1776 [Myxobolus squamalis]
MVAPDSYKNNALKSFCSKISEIYKLVGTVIMLVSLKACQFSVINEILTKVKRKKQCYLLLKFL